MLEKNLSKSSKSANINWDILDVLPEFYSTIQPFTSPVTEDFIQPAEAIFYYIYAILYSNTYRQKYQEFLKIDFPRIPFTKNHKLFNSLVILGEQLVKLHLLKSPLLDYPKIKFYGKGDNRVKKQRYNEKSRLAWINDSQYFQGINPEVWNYYIGGYQVLDKWLKDRKGRTLSSEDIKHYCKVATSLSETIEVQKRIDKLYPEVEKKSLGNLQQELQNLPKGF